MIFTKNQTKILVVLISHSEREYYLSELGEILGKLPGVFQKGINSLERQGVVLSRKKGNQRLCRINCDNPLFNEIKSIMQKTEGARGLLSRLVNGIKDVRIALLYGTYAKDALRADSDIDLLIVVSSDAAEDILLDKLGDIEKKLQRDINYKIYSKEEFFKKRKENDPFVTEVLSDKYILLKGAL